MSDYSGYYSGALSVACPKCGSAAGKKCRTIATARSTDTHAARYDVYYNKVKRPSYE